MLNVFLLVFCVSQPLRLTIILVSCFMFWCVFPTASLYDLIMDLQLPMIQSKQASLFLSLVTFSISLIIVSRLCHDCRSNTCCIGICIHYPLYLKKVLPLSLSLASPWFNSHFCSLFVLFRLSLKRITPKITLPEIIRYWK